MSNAESKQVQQQAEKFIQTVQQLPSSGQAAVMAYMRGWQDSERCKAG